MSIRRKFVIKREHFFVHFLRQAAARGQFVQTLQLGPRTSAILLRAGSNGEGNSGG